MCWIYFLMTAANSLNERIENRTHAWTTGSRLLGGLILSHMVVYVAKRAKVVTTVGKNLHPAVPQ